MTALYAQDSYSVKRLTLTGGLRWERLEGYLPEQSSPASRVFPVRSTANFPEQRDIVYCFTRSVRGSARPTT